MQSSSIHYCHTLIIMPSSKFYLNHSFIAMPSSLFGRRHSGCQSIVIIQLLTCPHLPCAITMHFSLIHHPHSIIVVTPQSTCLRHYTVITTSSCPHHHFVKAIVIILSSSIHCQQAVIIMPLLLCSRHQFAFVNLMLCCWHHCIITIKSPSWLCHRWNVIVVVPWSSCPYHHSFIIMHDISACWSATSLRWVRHSWWKCGHVGCALCTWKWSWKTSILYKHQCKLRLKLFQQCTRFAYCFYSHFEQPLLVLIKATCEEYHRIAHVFLKVLEHDTNHCPLLAWGLLDCAKYCSLISKGAFIVPHLI